MRQLDNEEAKKIELNILLDFHRFCEENGLTYFLAYGTLIGAIRHKGFIPWDDDVDVHMPRSDYNRLIELYNDKNPNGRYKVIAPNTKESMHSYIKVIDTQTLKIEDGIDYKGRELGVDIDVFPLDGQPDSDTEFNAWYDKLIRLYKICCYCLLDTKKSFKRFVAVPIIRIISGGYSHTFKKAEKLHKLYPYETSNWIGCVEGYCNSRGNRYKKEWFSDIAKVEFEGYIFNAPIEYDKVLKTVYGDYMKLPPVEKQVTHHTNKMYIKSNGE